MKKKVIISVIAIITIVIITIIGFIIFKKNNSNSENSNETIATQNDKYTPEEIVNKYVEAFKELNSSKLESLVDYKGVYSFEKNYNDLTKFEESYNNVDENSDEVKAYGEDMKYVFSTSIGFIKENYESYNIELEEIVGTKDNETFSGIKETEAKFKISYKLKDAEEEQETVQSIKFYIYNGKLVGLE